MQEVTHFVDGFRVRLQRRDEPVKYHAEAKDDVWARYEETFAGTAYDALSKLAAKTGIERDELLITFGLEP